MPIKIAKSHTIMRELPLALRARMKEDGLTQMALSKQTSVSQPEISRALAGKRKRLSEPMQRLCLYAGLTDARHEFSSSRQRLNALIEEIVGESDEAAHLIERTLLSLAPALAALRDRS